MSTLFVNTINTASGTDITIPTGKKLVVADEGGVIVPGTIIQVKSGVKRDTTAHTGATFSDIGLSATITPKQSNSHIMIVASVAAQSNQTSVATLRLLRDSTVILPDNPTSPGSRNVGMYDVYNPDAGGGAYAIQSLSFNFVDEGRSSGTSAITYKFQVKSHGGGLTVINRSATDSDASNYVRSTSHIQIMEVAQ
tara:strand:- start:403 stop:987 length:585 start_codon:yes stop_codon:yes gene_type:complete